jgi:dihydroxyacetone kinase
MLIALAASLSEAPAGLSTYAQFETDVLRPSLALDGAAAVGVETTYSSTVDRSAVEDVGSAK